jgi:hypothetical protein
VSSVVEREHAPDALRPVDEPKKTALPRPVAGRWPTTVLLAMILVPMGFNAVYLWPELALPIPSVNDDATHYMLLQRASEALASGENPLDHWVPDLELGFPWFLYYQNIPHLTVIALHRLLLGRVDLLTVFNGLRYLLLIVFPLTVYWSMRRMEFSRVAAAGSATAASLIAANGRYGFEYLSYVWLGFGMFTQLWAMHLSFVSLACLDRVVEKGKGYTAAIVALTVLVLSHLVYAYMMAITALLVALIGLRRANLGRRLGRMAVVGGLVAVITSYMSLPFLLQWPYLSASQYLQRWKYDSYGAQDILTALVTGELLDFGRLPVLTALLALGLAVAALARTRAARMALVLFVAWLLLYFGRPTWGALANLLPMHEGLLMHRFSGSVHLAAVLLIGLGVEWIWRLLAPLGPRWRPVVVVLLLLGLLVPAFRERRDYYTLNTQGMERTQKQLREADLDIRTIMDTLRSLPPGRTHAGLRANWGGEFRVGDLRVYDLLTFNRIVSLSPPYSSISHNADFVWHFDDHNPVHYELFDVKYLIAPPAWAPPEFLKPIKQTARYVLYGAPTRGYAAFVSITERAAAPTQASLFKQNLTWFFSDRPAKGDFTRYDFPSSRAAGPETAAGQGWCPTGRVVEQSVGPGRVAALTECPTPVTLAIKMTYHPNWRVTVDGAPASAFMVSPSFIGVALPAGRHEVRAEYRPGRFRMVLLAVGLVTFAGVVVYRRRLERWIP